jgi:preprotein translocase subunit YajC
MQALFNSTLALVSLSSAAESAPVSVPGGLDKFFRGWGSYIPMLLVFVIFYLLVIRPQSKRQKVLEEMLKSIKCGDYVLTHGGMYGFVSEYLSNEPYFKLEISKGVYIKMLKSAIAKVDNPVKA